jgi:uncharacterized membrane protein YeaQ/YmgE (transglycosylase-associated protein family)
VRCAGPNGGDWGRHVTQLWLVSAAARGHGALNRGSGYGFVQRKHYRYFIRRPGGRLACRKIVRGTGFGIIGDIIVGIAGAFITSLLFPRLGIHLGTGLVSEIIYSAIGAVLLLLIVRLLRGRF